MERYQRHFLYFWLLEKTTLLVTLESVENIYKNYKSCGIEDVSMKLYENDRHEILNEVDRSLVFDDLLTWMEKRKR